MLKKWKRLLIWLAVLLGFLAFCLWQNTWLTVTKYDFTHSEIPVAFDGYRIVQISDLHNATFGKENARLLAEIESLEPDCIVITGDIVDTNRTDIPTALHFVAQAVTLAPVYYITGNHEVMLSGSERARLCDGIQDAGALLLADEAVTLMQEGEDILLVGLCDEGLGGGNLRMLSESLDPDRFQILLAHEPQYFDDFCASGAELVLTGHAHGGQFRLPFFGGLYAPDQGILPEFSEGIHTSGDTSMIVSRGIGNSAFPLRLFNFPEIICIELHSASGGEGSEL